MTNDLKKQADNPKFMDRRGINIVISAVLFITNFLLVYFMYQKTFPEVAGFTRVAMVWLGAYAITWVMCYATKGLSRLVLSLIVLGVLYTVLMYSPR